MKTILEKIREDLFSMQDLPFRDFQAKLIPDMDKEKVIGVRTPDLRKYLCSLTIGLFFFSFNRTPLGMS